jgi:hypothetical protein
MALLTKLGGLTVVAVADLSSAAHAVNAKSSARRGEVGNGKHAGQMILVLTAVANVYDIGVALGPNPTDKWCLIKAGSAVTPS